MAVRDAVIAALALVVLPGRVEPAGATSLAAACRRACADEVRACIASGQRRAACRRRFVWPCRRAGTSVCQPADPGGPVPAGEEAGRVRFMKVAKAAFDRYTQAPSPAQQQWMRDHYWRMLTFAPYFDTRLAWYPDAWVYQDLYAIYPGQNVAAEHPEWILHDASGKPLYIPYGCGGGACPQYAGDAGNEAFRAHWIAEAVAHVAEGYRGLFLDDVNLALSVSDGAGTPVTPWDPRRAAPMTLADWRRYVAEFVEAIRAALPAAEIVHNQVWFAAPLSDPLTERTVAAADVISVERGFIDAGIRGGGGPFGFDTLAAYLDELHARGKGAVLESGSTTGRDYALATYFLVSTAADGLTHGSESLPDAWWSGWDVTLGAPAGARYAGVVSCAGTSPAASCS